MPISTSIIIPTFNNWPVLERCLDSLRTYRPLESEIIVIDNHSTDETSERLTDHSVRVLRQKENLFFTRAVNIGIEHAFGENIFVLNDDCIIKQAGWLNFFYECLNQDSRIAAVGPVRSFEQLPYGWIEPYAALYRGRPLRQMKGFPYYNSSFELWWSDLYLSYRLMANGHPIVPLEPEAVEPWIHHARVQKSGETVMRIKKTLPAEWFQFEGKETLYSRLGIQSEKDLAGYFIPGKTVE